jgi:hypothetical protein
LIIKRIVQVYSALTWNISLPPVFTAETADTTGNYHHKRCGHSTNDQQQLQIDLAIFAGKPGIATTRDLHKMFILKNKNSSFPY